MKGKDYKALCVFIGFICLLPLIIRNDYYIGILVFPTALNCLACIGLCLLMGYAGQISLGHAAFIAIGAYSSGILTVKLGWSPWTSAGAGVFLSSVTALVVGIPTLRLKGHYLAMATLGFGAIVHIVALAAVELTGGPEGINEITRFSLFGHELDTDLKYYYFSWAVVAAGLFFALNLIHSRVGRGLQAIHGSEDAAGSCGINTSVYKIRIFVLGAVYASIAGSLYAGYVTYIDPGPFDVMESVLLVTMVAVGGMNNIWGAITGAILLSLLPEFLSYSSDYFEMIGLEYNPDYDTLVYGCILLVIMLFMPDGLLAGIKSAGGRLVGMMKKGMMKKGEPA